MGETIGSQASEAIALLRIIHESQLRGYNERRHYLSVLQESLEKLVGDPRPGSYAIIRHCNGIFPGLTCLSRHFQAILDHKDDRGASLVNLSDEYWEFFVRVAQAFVDELPPEKMKFEYLCYDPVRLVR